MSTRAVTGGGGLTAVVQPARGAKIVSLRDGAGREWLAQADPVAHVGTAFTDAEMAGWDECAPSIIACEVGGRRTPDHGDLWDSAFEMEGDLARGHGDGYRFDRLIAPTPDGLRVTYRATSVVPMPFLWAAHPQFAAPPGTRVELPGQVTTVLDVLGDEPTPQPWTPAIAGMDDLARGGSRKFYVHPDQPVSSASIVRPDGATLAMRWSPECPYLGVWFDNGAFSREPVIAIEPSTGFYDSVARAEAAGRVARLIPGVPLEWWVELSVDW